MRRRPPPAALAPVVSLLTVLAACGGDDPVDPGDDGPGDANVDPVATFELVVSGAGVPVGVAVDGTASTDADGTVETWSWSFGDGTTAEGPVASHVYDDAGRYDVTLTVTDDGGDTATATRSVTVAASAPDRIAGVVWFDEDGDGVRTPGEGGLPDQTVFLDDDGDGALDTGERSTRTGAGGVYEFTGLAAGDYTVTQALGLGWTNTVPGPGIGGASSRFPGGPARILQGEDAPDEFPFMASIQIADEADRRAAHICGGSLIAPQWVLTASHCLADGAGQPFDPGLLEVLVGTNRLDGSGTRIPIAEIVLNPGYSPAGGFYKRDISLVRLASRVEGVPRVFLMDSTRLTTIVEPGDPGTVVGWGRVGDAGQIPVALQIAEIPLRPDQDCVDNWNQDEVERFDATMLCVGHRAGTPDTCSGDSGGPWMFALAGRFHQAGAVSWGPTPCGRPTVPSAFASVPAMYAFVGQHVPREPSGAVRVSVGPSAARADFGNFH